MKRKRKMLKQLKTLVGVGLSGYRSPIAWSIRCRQTGFQDTLKKTQRILNQQPQDKNKLYSYHAPKGACIAKGKVHKKYEFGVKEGITVTNKSNFVLGVCSFSGNPYDGHTLNSCL